MTMGGYRKDRVVSEIQIEDLAVLDGELMLASEASIPVTDDGFVRGDGVFEVFRVYEGQAFGLEEHMQRLLRSADGIMLREVDTNQIVADIEKLIAARGVDDYGVRIICTRGGHRVIKSEALHPYPPSLTLALVEYRTTVVLDGLKTLSYGGNALANRIAQERGFDEALLITPEDSVLEGPTATLFWSPDGETLVTPPLDEAILASITRQVLIEKLPVQQRVTTRQDVLTAKEAFLCSSVREVQAVGQIEDNRMAVPGPLTAAAKTALAGVVEARVNAASANNV